MLLQKRIYIYIVIDRIFLRKYYISILNLVYCGFSVIAILCKFINPY